MEQSRTLRVATFNLKHGATEAGYRGNPTEVAAACADIEADILALQEVDDWVWRSKWANLTAMIAEATGMNAVFAKTMRMQGGSYGNALLVRGEIEEVEIVPLQGGRRHVLPFGPFKKGLLPEARNAILATTQVGGHEISVAATHLAVERSVHCSQLAEVIGRLSCRPGKHILLGDLNQRPSALRGLLPETMQLVTDCPTNPATYPMKQIDHIGVRGLTVCAAEARQLSISDHRALVVDVR